MLETNQQAYLLLDFFMLLFYSGTEAQRRHFCGACKGTENRRTCCDRLRCT